MSMEKFLHALNALALILTASYFVIRLEANSDLLAQKLEQIDTKLTEHQGTAAHHGARQNIADIAVSVGQLLKITEIQQKEIERLRDE